MLAREFVAIVCIVEFALLIAGVSAAIVVGVAWAVHSHDLAEGADKVGQWAVGGTMFLAFGEAGSEFKDYQSSLGLWSLRYRLGYTSDPPPKAPTGWGILGHLGWQYLQEILRDLAISGAVFAVGFLILRAVKSSQPTKH